MSIENDSDRLYLVQDFGEEITFSPGNVWPDRASTSASVYMIFDREYMELPGEQIVTSSSNPIAQCRTSDVEGVKFGSVIERPVSDYTGAIEKYKVVDVQPDGLGMTVLILEGPVADA